MDIAVVEALAGVKSRVSADHDVAMTGQTDAARTERLVLERVMIYLDEAMTAAGSHR